MHHTGYRKTTYTRGIAIIEILAIVRSGKEIYSVFVIINFHCILIGPSIYYKLLFHIRCDKFELVII